MTSDEEITREKAMVYFEQAYRKQMDGEFGDAIVLYKRSIATYPTAEAYTFLGWTYSQIERIDEAIAMCHQAIETDPSYGNPYNDIGSYLTIQGRVDEAIPWFERAMLATRYEPRHFPHMNLGRIYITKNLLKAAREQFRKALAYAPDNRQLRLVIQQLDEQLN